MPMCFYVTALVVLTLVSAKEATDRRDYMNTSTSRAKSWMTYLTYTVKEWLQDTELAMVQYWQEVRHPIRRLISWCEPSLDHNMYSNETKLQIHLRRWGPCGYGFYHLLTIRYSIMVSWAEIQVPSMYYIHFIFLFFEVDDSNNQCHNSALTLMKGTITEDKTTWTEVSRYCGYREPWNATIESSIAAFYINQKNVYRLINMTVKYVTIDRPLSWLYHADPNVTYLYLVEPLQLRIFHNGKFQRQWVIKVYLGFVQRLDTLWIASKVKYLNIFDGLKKWFPLFIFNRRASASFNQTFNCTTQYFQSLMILDVDSTVFNDTLMKLTFRRWKMDIFDLRTNTETYFNSSDQITYSVFSIKPDQGMFSTLYMVFRKFQGWNLGGCNYGGYAIQQNIDDPILIPTIIGPFCSATSPRYEYTSQLLLPQIVMNNRTAHLIIYGYSHMYTIDVVIKIYLSPCEGIFEPLLMWYPDHGNTRLILDDVLSTTFATVSLKVFYSNKTSPLHMISFRNVSKCFYMQTMSYPTRKMIHYDIVFEKGDIQMKYYRPPSYLEEWVHRLYAMIWIKFTRPYERPAWRQFRITSIVKILDIKQLNIEHYTGEAYDYVSYFSVFEPITETVLCLDSDDTPTTPHKLISHKGIIYLTTYMSCMISMDALNATYVYVLQSKLSTQQYTSKSIWYIHYLRVDCIKTSSEGWDVLTTRLTVDHGYVTSHSIDLIKSEVYLESYHNIMSFVYRRRQQCKSVVMRYRDVSVNLLASYIEMNKQGRARIKVNIAPR